MTQPMKAPATATLLDKTRRRAKAIARSTDLSHAQALEQAAAQAGYASWHELRTACAKPAATSADGEIPVDPKLPRLFDQTPNEERSKAQLDAWWDKPFAITRADGQLDVRCLDGGAWDRSSWYGVAPDREAAAALARAKLARWRGYREEPVVSMAEDGRDQVVRMPQRPDQEMEVLYTAVDHGDAARWLAEFRRQASAESSAPNDESPASPVG